MQHISGNLIVSRWPIMNGSAQNPALNFSGANQSGLSYSNTVNIHVIQNTPLVIQNTGITLPGTCTGTKFIGNGAQLTMTPPLALSNVQIVDAMNVLLDDTALDSSNQGYLRLNGRGFAPGSLVSVGNTLATSATVYSQNQLFVQIPPKSSGTYSISITRADGISTTLPMAVSFSPFPVWTSATTLANVFKTVAFTQTLSASEGTGSIVSYAIASGSALPSGVTLSSGGIVSGNITMDPGNATTYYFSIDAVDTSYQNIPRTFGLTALSPFIVASGGSVSYFGSYKIHTFTTSGTFTVTSMGGGLDIIVVGGGGGGGYGAGGGGGAGGVLRYSNTSISVGAYAITVGTGGSQTDGTPSQIAGVTGTAYGGARGNSWGAGNTGGPFGSGGGGTTHVPTGTNGTSGQGGNGGVGFGNGGDFSLGGGGGGGSGLNGGDYVASSRGGNGGAGIASDINGTMVVYAGGGGGGAGSDGSLSAGTGGSGGGGNGGKGAANGGNATGYGSGGGGGGVVYNQPVNANVGGNGSSGIVIVRYMIP